MLNKKCLWALEMHFVKKMILLKMFNPENKPFYPENTPVRIRKH